MVCVSEISTFRPLQCFVPGLRSVPAPTVTIAGLWNVLSCPPDKTMGLFFPVLLGIKA